MAKVDKVTVLYDYDIVEDFKLTDDLKEVMKYFSEIDLTGADSISPRPISKLKLWTDTKSFMENNFILHDVGYLGDTRLIRALSNEMVFGARDIADIFNKNIRYRNPFFLPIEFSREYMFGGAIVCQSVVNDTLDKDNELQKLLDVCFSKIVLPRKPKEIAVTSYAHEITHSQVLSNKGSVENFYDNEVLSIYVELLHAYQSSSDLFKLDLLNRIEQTLANFYTLFIYLNGDRGKLDKGYNEFNFHKDAQYLQSILVAFNILTKTIYGTENTKKTIKRQLQKVFDGKITVEQFMKSVGATYEESLDTKYTKKLLKKVGSN